MATRKSKHLKEYIVEINFTRQWSGDVIRAILHKDAKIAFYTSPNLARQDATQHCKKFPGTQFQIHELNKVI